MDHIEMLNEEFELWWQEVEAFAEQYQMSITHVEEEFCLDGEFIPIHLVYEDDFDFEPRDENI